MAHITLSIPDSVYSEMKKHPEIKWSEVARKSIIEKTVLLKGGMGSKELLDILPAETRKGILNVPESKWADFYKEVDKAKWKRTKYSTQV